MQTRNCDRFAEKGKAIEAFEIETGRGYSLYAEGSYEDWCEFVHWLFSVETPAVKSDTFGNAVARDEAVLRLSKDENKGMQEALSEHDRMCEMLSKSRRSVGNSAAMREALDDILDKIDTWRMEGSIEHWQYSQLFDIVDAALSAPARNCDRFADETDAQIAFLNEVWLISVTKETALERDRFENWTDEMRSRYAKWLFAPAAEQKGE